jgi:hypothetical protein
MPDFSITDSRDNPVDISTVSWTSASSLFNYAKSELFHLTVAPEFVELKDKLLTQAAPKPTSFRLSLQHEFQLGNTTPEINLTPGAKVEVLVNATAGSNLFDDDSFHVPAKVPADTGYVGMSLQGSLDLGVCGSSGDLTFGIDRNAAITIEFVKAFPTAQNQPSLWTATAAMISDFVIPANVSDLRRLNPNDVCSVSGAGSLKISGSVSVSLPVNPLASVNLPLGVGTLEIKDGLMAGLCASFTISGSYQIRLERLGTGAVRLSYIRQAGTAMQTDLTASAGVSADLGTTDLLAKLLGTIGTGKVDSNVLARLTSDEVDTFNAAIKKGLDHSLQASIDYGLSASTDNKTAFQYEIQPGLLDTASTEAVNRALKGDLGLLTALEERAQSDGTIAAGVKLLNSVFSTAKSKGFSVKVNLLGIVNLISCSNLIGKCEFLFEPASGDLTIKETAESDRISAISDPYNRQAALRKALFDSVLATTTYVVSKTVTMPALSCQTVHFAANQNTSVQTIADYTNWFVRLNLLKPEEQSAILSHVAAGGFSTCIMRAPLDDAACEALFFDGHGNPRTRSEYLEIGRQALRALLNPAGSDMNRLRCQLLDDAAKWSKALQIGPDPGLRELIPLKSSDPEFTILLGDVTGDVYDIAWWADAIVNAGQSLLAMRAFLSGRDPASLASDPAFATQRNALQQLMLKVVSSSKVRFDEPWGMVCLYWAAGSRSSSGKLTSRTLTLERESPVGATVAAGKSAQGS